MEIQYNILARDQHDSIKLTSPPRDEELLDFVSVQRHIFKNYNTEKKKSRERPGK